MFPVEKSMNDRAVERLFKRYYRPLVLFANGYLHSLAEAEDLVSEQFTRLWDGGRLAGVTTAAESTYLFTVTRNACINFLEKKKLPVTAIDLPHHRIAAREADALDDDEAAVIRAALANLPERTRQVVESVVILDNSYKEAADSLGISVNTVKTLLRLGMKELREGLGRRLKAAR
ncbi:MAG: sigma-70 family RNA polymerase sigma factor [Odoribacteraceae bacterium]|jgi:RNA polymerase sigma-70 factor (ECF subfamily)|nr:sigma-70 family RNA polymerase sigma factor [Odoribacteraceae bacterium]